jgi:hypothetical protein
VKTTPGATATLRLGAHRVRVVVMRSLRFAPCWIAIGWTLVAGLVVASLVTVPDEVRELGSVDKLVHVVLYLLVMAWFVQIWSAQRVILAYAAFLVVLGIVLEILQGAGGHRTADGLDAVANAGGVVLGWMTSRTPVSGLLERLEGRLPTPR